MPPLTDEDHEQCNLQVSSKHTVNVQTMNTTFIANYLHVSTNRSTTHTLSGESDIIQHDTQSQFA